MLIEVKAERYDDFNRRYDTFWACINPLSVSRMEEELERGYYGTKKTGRYIVYFNDGGERILVGLDACTKILHATKEQ